MKLFKLYNSKHEEVGVFANQKIAIGFAICYSKEFHESYTIKICTI